MKQAKSTKQDDARDTHEPADDSALPASNAIAHMRKLKAENDELRARCSPQAELGTQNMIATGLALSDDQRVVLKAACDELRTDIEHALYETRGLLGGAVALRLKAQGEEEPSPEIPFHIEHCVGAATGRIEAIQCVIEDRFRAGRPPSSTTSGCLYDGGSTTRPFSLRAVGRDRLQRDVADAVAQLPQRDTVRRRRLLHLQRGFLSAGEVAHRIREHARRVDVAVHVGLARRIPDRLDRDGAQRGQRSPQARQRGLECHLARRNHRSLIALIVASRTRPAACRADRVSAPRATLTVWWTCTSPPPVRARGDTVMAERG